MIKILLCDDHALIMEGLASLINNFEGCEVVYKAVNGGEVIEFLKQNTPPDIIMLDIRMPNGISGFELAMHVNSHYPEIKMIACTGIMEEMAVVEMFIKGVKGYISKDSLSEELKDAIFEVYNGELHYKNSFLSNTTKIDFKHHKKTKIFSNFTEHELKIARLMASNLTYKQIADEMNITPNSLENIQVKIFQKLNLQTRVEVVVFLINVGLI